MFEEGVGQQVSLFFLFLFGLVLAGGFAWGLFGQFDQFAMARAEHYWPRLLGLALAWTVSSSLIGMALRRVLDGDKTTHPLLLRVGRITAGGILVLVLSVLFESVIRAIR